MDGPPLTGQYSRAISGSEPQGFEESVDSISRVGAKLALVGLGLHLESLVGIPGRTGVAGLRVTRLNLKEGAAQCGQLVAERSVAQVACGLLWSAGAIVQQDVDEVVIVLDGRPRPDRDTLRQEISLQPGEADTDRYLGAVGQRAAQLLPCEIAGDVAGPAQVGRRQLRTAAGTNNLALALVGQVAQKLEFDHHPVDLPARPPAVVAGVRLELDALEGPFDAARGTGLISVESYESGAVRDLRARPSSPMSSTTAGRRPRVALPRTAGSSSVRRPASSSEPVG